MYKTFIAGLSLGLLLLTPITLNASSSLFDSIPRVLSEDGSFTSPMSSRVSDVTSKDVANLNLFRAHSTLSDMSQKERNDLAKRLGSSKRIDLERIIPEEHKETVIKDSCCCLFWKGCFRVSSKTLGSLAIDIILDLSDGKLDGKGPNGSIDYIHHIAEIINATIEEVRAERK
ncbi:MAG: hypothetical protein I8H80_01360 [Alphaproteobacteria bacterium]|nr:hypothetical protein [Alphaproteobacteria bacterium]